MDCEWAQPQWRLSKGTKWPRSPVLGILTGKIRPQVEKAYTGKSIQHQAELGSHPTLVTSCWTLGKKRTSWF